MASRPITSFMGRNPLGANWYTFVNDCSTEESSFVFFFFALGNECGLWSGYNDDLRTHCLGCTRIFTGHQASVNGETPRSYSRVINSLRSLGGQRQGRREYYWLTAKE